MQTATQSQTAKGAAPTSVRPRTDTFLAKCSNYLNYVETYLASMNVRNPYLRVLDPCAGTEVLKDGKTLIMLGSNNYLGLATHPAVIKAAKKAIDIYGTGCSSSRPLAGTTSLHVELEKELAEFKAAEASLLFSTGYMTMMGVIYALAGENDVVFSDQLNHASIIDGVKLSRAQNRVFRHGDMEHLEELLAGCDPEVNKLIVTDGVFSMKGDLADLPAIKRLADRYGAWIMIDDAHGSGVMGENGRGVAEHFGLEGEIDLVCCTFSKVFGTVGGAVAAKRDVIEFLKFNSRPFVFTASLPPSVIATVLASLRVIKGSPHLLRDLRRNAKILKDGLTGMGFPVMPTPTPVIPIPLGNDSKVFRLAWGLEDEGVFVNPIVPPAVSAESSLIRVTAMATHTDEELEFALDKFRLVGRRLGLI
ncbi:MAG: aminotransferase class I/II-fold pyridoxal phosphate-dependent enzyme [Candidatus Aminicenantales bacterium]